MIDWALYLRDMWHSDGRGQLIDDAVRLALLAAIVAFGLWFFREVRRRREGRGFEPLTAEKERPR